MLVPGRSSCAARLQRAEPIGCQGQQTRVSRQADWKLDVEHISKCALADAILTEFRRRHLPKASTCWRRLASDDTNMGALTPVDAGFWIADAGSHDEMSPAPNRIVSSARRSGMLRRSDVLSIAETGATRSHASAMRGTSPKTNWIVARSSRSIRSKG